MTENDQMIKRIREVQKSVPEYLTGTVVSDGTYPVQVVLDSDPSRVEITPNSNLVGALARGVRVGLLRQSPSLLVIVGALYGGTDGTIDSGWLTVGGTGVPFEGTWVNVGSGEEVASYRKINNQIHLRGLITGDNGFTPIIFLPVDMRPKLDLSIPAVVNGSIYTSGPASAGTAHTHLVTATNIASILRITSSSGEIQIGSSITSGFVSLSGVSFFVD